MVIHPSLSSSSLSTMPLLRSPCASSSPSFPNPTTTQLSSYISAKPSPPSTFPTTTAHQSANISPKPSAPSPSPTTTTSTTADFPLPLPDLPADVKQKILSLEVLGVDSGRALSLNPDLRDASLESVHSVITYLLSKGIHHKDLPKIIGMCPRILTSSIRHDLSPVFAFLSRDLRVPDSDFRRVVCKCPRLLASSVRDQLKPALIYLQRLGFKDPRPLAYHESILLVSSVQNTLIPKLEHLVGLGLSREEAVVMVLRCPSLFTFSIENNFKPKYEYFAGEMGGSLDELKQFPQYFAFSLEKRIKPRHQELRERGLSMPLSMMLKSTDEEFKELLEKST